VRLTSWRDSVTRYQWLVLLAAWLGWVFDSMDATIYTLVLQPALSELLRPAAGGPVASQAVTFAARSSAAFLRRRLQESTTTH